MFKALLLVASIFFLISCRTSKPHLGTVNDRTGISAANPGPDKGPPIWVYKTKKDYRNYVPVLLSADKSRIVSYPAPADLLDGATLRKPLQLKDGYLLDQRGIGVNVAFLNLTYEEYASLPEAPSKKVLLELIQDADPLLELCNCGSRNAFTGIAEQLDQLIDDGTLRQKCKTIK